MRSFERHTVDREVYGLALDGSTDQIGILVTRLHMDKKSGVVTYSAFIRLSILGPGKAVGLQGSFAALPRGSFAGRVPRRIIDRNGLGARINQLAIGLEMRQGLLMVAQ
ncbi:MAG: hypothetical protein ACI9TP_001281 [Candidatus Azotimanducaceae bacterium]